MYTEGIKHVLVTRDKEEIKLRQEEGLVGHDREKGHSTLALFLIILL